MEGEKAKSLTRQNDIMTVIKKVFDITVICRFVMSNDFALFHVVSRKKNLVSQSAIFCHALVFYFWTVIVQL